MSKAKKDINQNFEMLKAQMQAKRQKAEKQSEQEAKVNEKINTEVVDIKDNANDKEIKNDKIQDFSIEKEMSIPSENIDISSKTLDIQNEKEPLVNEEIINVSEKEYKEEDYKTIEKKNKRLKKRKVDELTEEDEASYSESFEEEDDDEIITSNKEGAIKIKIKKREKPEAPRRATYYLKQETIRKIEKVSKISGIGKSKLVQLLLDQALDNLEIEK
ncbi:MAG: hypothetical protein ACRDAU_07190 [Clostridium sp.]